MNDKWEGDTDPTEGSCLSDTYRTKMPAGHYKPEAVEREAGFKRVHDAIEKHGSIQEAVEATAAIPITRGEIEIATDSEAKPFKCKVWWMQERTDKLIHTVYSSKQQMFPLLIEQVPLIERPTEAQRREQLSLLFFNGVVMLDDIIAIDKQMNMIRRANNE